MSKIMSVNKGRCVALFWVSSGLPQLIKQTCQTCDMPRTYGS